MLRRSERQEEEVDSRTQSSSEDFDDSASSKQISDFSGWRISTTKKPFGLCNLADEIQNWMLRAELSGRRDGTLDDATKAIIAEFENDTPQYDAPVLRLGGAAGEMAEGAVESWFKEKGIRRDNDPSGVLERAEGYIAEAARLNMSYVDYVAAHVKRPRVPTVETLRPYSAPPRPPGIERLVTTPHSYPGAPAPPAPTSSPASQRESTRPPSTRRRRRLRRGGRSERAPPPQAARPRRTARRPDAACTLGGGGGWRRRRRRVGAAVCVGGSAHAGAEGALQRLLVRPLL
jgi:hypothetical protein